MSDPGNDRPRTVLQLLYGNWRRWAYIAALIVVLLALKSMGYLG